ncbi:hypothetical protein OBBRIDRAFT_797601 [Obba rivulosa]|uniref:Uncharacterized protein n=1 Tax=Obba rivulosa TaxID=1052685 RepID=A0A8E2DHN3_9APHY|nr:hypothetical protein OBBRIDRAFT_797601 [Obba rivulosa]
MIDSEYFRFTIPDLRNECLVARNVTIAMDTNLTIISRSCLIGSDAIVLAVTWARSYSTKKMVDVANVKVPLVSLLLRDGTFYFLCGHPIESVSPFTGVVGPIGRTAGDAHMGCGITSSFTTCAVASAPSCPRISSSFLATQIVWRSSEPFDSSVRI